MRYLQINGGEVRTGDVTTLWLPPTATGYADAQLDDYSGRKRRRYPHWPGTTLSLTAHFSAPGANLCGTAGFGFWNAPFGDPTVPTPALPQAAWFFFASPPNNLPLAADGPGRGWFAATLDATTWLAWGMVPLAPFVLLLNQFRATRQGLWPHVQRALGIRYQPLDVDMTAWHLYNLVWERGRALFAVDEKVVLETDCAPRGPLGFVAWIDNQYMIVTPRGRVGWGTIPTTEPQWLAIRDLHIYS